jgi:hypothetical protein
VNKTEYFDQVISNVPAKVGREQLSIILYDAFDALKPGHINLWKSWPISKAG